MCGGRSDKATTQLFYRALHAKGWSNACEADDRGDNFDRDRPPNRLNNRPPVTRIHLQPATGARIVLRRPAQDVDRRVGSIQAARRNALFQQRQRRDQPDTKKTAFFSFQAVSPPMKTAEI
jgi:hypothetical protein